MNFPTLRSATPSMLLSLLLASGIAHAGSPVTLDNAGATVVVSETAVLVTKGEKPILRLEAFRFNFERVDNWEIGSHDSETITLRATVPPSVDSYRAATDNRARDLEITVSKVEGGFRFFSDPAWGRQVSMEFTYLGDHFFGLSEPLQPDNRLTPISPAPRSSSTS